MGYKARAVALIAALGIPLFPLGARWYLSRGNAAGLPETAGTSRGFPEFPGPETPDLDRAGAAPAERSAAETFPPVSPETLARVFSPPNKAAAGEERPGESGAVPRAQPVPGEGKFAYLGSIRKSDDQEWLYLKEAETGRVVAVNPLGASANGERWVVEIGGITYGIRRN
jgi:hypothetical protein